jgi:hypothetical protein
VKKGIVLELDEEFVTVLTPEGEFLQVKKEGEYEIGEEIEARVVKKPFPFRRRSFRYAAVSVVAAAVLLVVTWLQWPSDSVYAYMSIDINPSIEAGVDGELRVLTLKAYNEEGKKVMASLPPWKERNFSDVAKQIIALSEQKGYLNKGGEVLITAVEKEHDSSSAQKLSAELAKIQQSVADDHIVVTTAKSTMEVRNQAAKKGMTTGKLLQIEKKATPASPVPAKLKKKEKGQSEKKNNQMSAPKQPKPQLSPRKQEKDEKPQPKQKGKEKQPYQELKNHPANGEQPPKKSGNARPSRPGGHYVKKKVERQSQKEKARSQNRKADGRNDAKHGRQLKVNSKTKEAE